MVKRILFILPVIMALLVCLAYTKQTKTPWTEKQLIEPATLAAIIKNTSVKQPVIYSIGFGAGIKNSIIEGPSSDTANLNKWKAALDKLPRNSDIVIYCGCCPFEHCPNVRPAFALLNSMGFTNHKLLNLSHNLKADWIDKGFPQ